MNHPDYDIPEVYACPPVEKLVSVIARDLHESWEESYWPGAGSTWDLRTEEIRDSWRAVAERVVIPRLQALESERDRDAGELRAAHVVLDRLRVDRTWPSPEGAHRVMPLGERIVILADMANRVRENVNSLRAERTRTRSLLKGLSELLRSKPDCPWCGENLEQGHDANCDLGPLLGHVIAEVGL